MTVSSGPQRTCIACRQARSQDQLVRYVVAPDGALLVDYRHRLPGRGAYTCIDLQCLQTAVTRKQFQRSFQGKCSEVSFVALQDGLQQALLQRITNLIGMARKSSQVSSGSNAVIAALRQRSLPALVLMSEDISAGIAEKIRELSDRQNVSCSQMFTKGMLGQVLGKGERSVLAIQAGPLADAFLLELQRYTQMVREN
ncbi:MAG TPA: DUF448 domain-containing protein [Malonomonas sp.]